MDDYFLSLRRFLRTFSCLRNWKSRFKGVRTKKRNILITIILAVAASLFFSIFFDRNAQAEQSKVETKKPGVKTIDPMNKIGKGLISIESQENNNSCLEISEKKEIISENDPEKDKTDRVLSELVAGHPISEMIPYISKRDKKVAAFLIAIAKKESDWGTHSPKMNGQDCHNYWGYKGGYKLTSSGYSCFDSPQQAVAVVGDRIESLVNKNIDTPERMLVWKCGSSCKGHDPFGVRKWVSDVSHIFYKLMS